MVSTQLPGSSAFTVIPQTSELPQNTAELRSRIDGALSGFSDFSKDCPRKLRDAIRYSLLAPGKRLRPLLVLWATDACNGSIEAAMPAACAVEMVHAYSLVHDDLPAMDNDDLRRGMPTCHKKFGEAIAVLAGDALLALAFQTIAEGVRPCEKAAACCRVLAEAAGPCRLVGGQADDIEGFGVPLDVQALESNHRRKTGALIEAAMRLGALVAGADLRDTDALVEYGRQVGLAFQISDDLLDVRGNEATAGKRLGKDSGKGRTTFPGLLGIDESMRRAEELVEAACRALEPFGARARNLECLAGYIVERNR